MLARERETTAMLEKTLAVHDQLEYGLHEQIALLTGLTEQLREQIALLIG